MVWGCFNDLSAWSPGDAYIFNGASEIQSITNMHRIVSAALYIQPEPSLATDQGEMTVWVSPFRDFSSPQYIDYANLYKSVIIPLNANKASCVRWFPIARQDWSYKTFCRTNGREATDDDISEKAYPFWQLGVATEGCAPGISIRVTMVINYEFIPTNNTLNVLGASPSPQDVTEVDLVENWVQDMPIGNAIPQSQAAKSPSNTPVEHGSNDAGTGFGMFFNVVKELAPIALALL
jgi:hypothetical protein